jgi:hypothetical protein
MMKLISAARIGRSGRVVASTSVETFQDAKKLAAKRAERAFNLIQKSGARGLTNDELSVITGWAVHSCSTIMTRLTRKGRIRSEGKRRTRLGGTARVKVVGRDPQEVDRRQTMLAIERERDELRARVAELEECGERAVIGCGAVCPDCKADLTVVAIEDVPRRIRRSA